MLKRTPIRLITTALKDQLGPSPILPLRKGTGRPRNKSVAWTIGLAKAALNQVTRLPLTRDFSVPLERDTRVVNPQAGGAVRSTDWEGLCHASRPEQGFGNATTRPTTWGSY